MSNLLEYKGYHGSIEYSAEDNCLFGKIEFINDLITFDGQDVTEVRKAFEQAVDDYLAHCERAGIQPNAPFKGSFNVRVSPELHRRAVIEAKKRGKSLNELVLESITCLLDGTTVVHNHNSFHIDSRATNRFATEQDSVLRIDDREVTAESSWTLQ